MYYHLKDELSCQDCKHPLKISEDDGYMAYVAYCIACGKQYEITLDVRLKRD